MIKFRENLKAYTMIFPAILGVVLFTIYPVIRLIQLSFMKTNMLDKSKTCFVGIENFTRILARVDFIKSFWNTLVYTISVVALIMIFAILMALWLNSQKDKLTKILQVSMFSPHIISIVSVALIWLLLMEPNFGLLNYFLRSIGQSPVMWLESSDTALPSIILLSVWKSVGYYTLIILGALQTIPKEIYEASELDNASKIKVLFKITLPMISPQIFFVLIIMTIASFKMFETARVMTGGGPNNATSTLVYVIYKEVFYYTRIGYAAAAGVILIIIVGILTIFYFKTLAKKVHYQ